ncbi:hypothetical protein PR202_gb18193 [Eleusine coracana subsp. coracana]|uniref:EamA domain-containing protein n=1 Tax=Eleusine coracana subsp. coracana TaxID=191504 RepID=A0AAV5F4Y3_ELECO|nr:hypothetical protein PR202_gb18193 [Eleusine coracana subsp. coracana]
MLVFDFISAATTALIKKALEEGLDRLVLITLRQLVATVFLAPIAYFKERSTRPKLTLEILVYLFFSAAFGAALSQYTFFYGLQYTTATFAITFTNLSPVLTFLIAVLLRVETLNVKSKAGVAKVAGTLMSFAGVMLLTVYKGVALTHQVVSSVSPDHHAAPAEPSKKSWTLGTVALLANCLCFSFWLLLQSKLTKKYPALYSSTAYMFLISSVQGGGLTAAIQRRASVWVLTRPVEIVAVIYTSLVVRLLEMWSSGCWEKWMPMAAMVTTNIVIAIMTALLKQALNLGMNRLVLITFRQMAATVFLAPIAYFKERKTRPKFTLEIFVYMFLSGLIGPVLLQYTLFVGLEYTTATFAATFSNMLPVVTFLISLAFRFETLEVRSKSGSAKISGTLISLSGAMMLTFYKGSTLTHNSSSSGSTGSSSSNGQSHGGEHGTVRWVLGSVSMLANVVGFALWLLLQRKFTKKYPAVYSATAFMSLFSFFQAGALALSIQRNNISMWALKGRIEIITVVYCGVVASGIGYLLLTYCVEKRGPVFTSAFSPLSQIFVAGIDLFILHEPLYLGSVLGSVLVIVGLYLVLWGKKEESATAIASAKPAQQQEDPV